MRFTAAVLAFAAGACATSASSAITEVVTTFETYCPEATSFVAGGSTVHVTTPGTYTLSGSYTVTRPLLSSTITVCNSCASSSAPVPLGTGSPAPYTSVTPAPAPGSPGSTTKPSTPAFTAGAAPAVAGAGAGLAAVLGVAAALL
ncbi:hypothetical protein BGW36DRAFT_379924 [Talaromyces proteolyticus]|uniref:Clock-controlled protein 6 n=1 Tax=Talaromyces proteolyticus TaxID=1131652 RepID=A0AAD4KP24_9EURO|nr:uncharacterized protein BGW36DRAFT_379924 [Talaromyces proteolyticus]KAH8695943.1 hypothetical protein BGW36DRAFT_379924 [Talaromyces proteolyticus]